ncbi:MAG: hypothetical protein ACXW2T_03120, partial [Allosphingosinicella sp.]
PPSAEDSAKLRAIVARGRLLFDLDRAAWVATDDFLKKVRDPVAAGFKGYVVDREGEGFAVTFYGGDGDRLTARYVAQVSDGRVTSSRVLAAAEQVPLTPLQLRMAKARSVSAGSDLRPCTNAPFNRAIIPPASLDEPLEMYLTSAQTDSNVYPFGGHYLLSIALDGRLLSVRKFTNSCLNMPARPPGGNGTSVALYITHLLDPIPTEIHVFFARTAGLPLMVGTAPNRVWEVTADSIRPISMPTRPARRRRRD